MITRLLDFASLHSYELRLLIALGLILHAIAMIWQIWRPNRKQPLNS